jgi:hypothetical protein
VYEVQASTGQVDAVAGRIAASICDENGKAVFTPGIITGDEDPERGALDGNLTIALLEVIGQVNRLGKTQSPTTKRKSGTSSSSRGSAGAPSKKRKAASATPSSAAGSPTEESAAPSTSADA